MNWLDIVLLVLLAISIFNGLRRGLIKTAFSIAGVIIGVILASRFYDDISGWFGFGSNTAFSIFAFILILVLAMLAATLLANMIRTAASAVLLGWVDRLGGAIIGLLGGVIMLGALLALWVKLFGSGIVTESTVASLLTAKFPLVLALLPAEFDTISDFFSRLLY
jgi:membrane protein required for colicin V production